VWLTSRGSASRNCSHLALPFVEAAAKAKLAGSIETQPGGRLAALSAFGIIHVPIIAARNKDVRRERVLFGFHCCKLRLDIAQRRSEPFQCILKSHRPHDVQSNISAAERQAGERLDLPCLLTRDKVSKLKRRAPRKHVPSKLVLRKQRDKVPETAEERFVP
jgi:hypothetical protein